MSSLFLKCNQNFFFSKILSLAEQIQFTEDVESAIKDHSLQQLELELMAKLEHYTSIDNGIEDTGSTGIKMIVNI